MISKEVERLLKKVEDENRVAYEILKEDLSFPKIPLDIHEELINYALDVGEETANSMLEEFGISNPFTICDRLKLKVVIDTSSIEKGRFIFFSKYQPSPPKIIIYQEAINILQALIEKHNIRSKFFFPDLLSIQVAHELFHHLEKTRVGIVARRLRVYTFKFGPIKISSKVKALSEIAAHTFSKNLLGLPFHPRLFDYLFKL